MKRSLLQTAFVGWIALLVASPVAEAGGYESLGVTRASVEAMLKAEGLNPKQNTFPDFEGEKVTELNVFNPFISIQMFGPDGGLTAIEVTVRPSADADDAYWQSYVCLGAERRVPGLGKPCRMVDPDAQVLCSIRERRSGGIRAQRPNYSNGIQSEAVLFCCKREGDRVIRGAPRAPVGVSPLGLLHNSTS